MWLTLSPGALRTACLILGHGLRRDSYVCSLWQVALPWAAVPPGTFGMSLATPWRAQMMNSLMLEVSELYPHTAG
jgi:hypothetical protein